jgi:hypothetical protein
MAFVKFGIVQMLTCCTVFGFSKVDNFVGSHRLVDIIRLVNPISTIKRDGTNKDNRYS